MNERPRANETEEDLLRLQAKFEKEKAKPSVTVKKADKRKAPGSSSSALAGGLVAGTAVKKDVVTLPGLPPTLPAGGPESFSHPQKRSKFKAKREAAASRGSSSGPLSGQRVTFDLDDDEVDDPEAAMDRHDTHITAVLSKIREQDTREKPVFLPQSTDGGFPTALHRSQATSQPSGPKPEKKRSLFAQQFESTPPVDFGVTLSPPVRAVPSTEPRENVSMETEDSRCAAAPSSQPIPSSSIATSAAASAGSILDGTGLMNEGVSALVAKKKAQEIQADNASKMAAMSEAEILQEQAKLKAMLDPSLVAFLQAKKQGSKQLPCGESLRHEQLASEQSSTTLPSSSTFKNEAEQKPELVEEMETCVGVASHPVAESLTKEAATEMEQDEQGSRVAVDKTEKVPVAVKDEWLNMKSVEGDKLQWMADLPKPSAKSKAGSQARFDFNGQLVARNVAVPVREGLFHHGDEQEVPGYTLEELFTLSRSAVIQQRVLALQTLAKIIHNYRSDCLVGQLRSPLISRLLKAGVVFLLRWSMDDSNEGVLSAGIEALAALLVQPGDEEALDKVFTWHQGCCVPPMLPQKRANDEEEDEDDLDDEEDDDEEEEGQKQSKPDQHIASQDVIKGLLKMSVLSRLRYILEVVRPTPPVILHILAILIRISRHSTESATEVFRFPRLLDTVFREFLPTTSWHKQDDPVSCLYGHPTVLAMKLARVLCLGGRHIAATMLSKYPLLTAILRYTSMEPTNMNLNVGEAYMLSTESLRAWSVCVRYGLACDAYRELYPLLMQQLQLFQRLSVLPLPSTEEKVTVLVHNLQLIRATALISLLEGVVQVAGTANELQAKLAMRNDATDREASRETLSPPPIDWSHVTGLATPLETCAHRWLVEMTGCTEILAPEANSLAASALDFLATFYAKYTLQPSYNAVDSLHHIEDLVNGILLPYMQSSSFHSAVHNLQLHSSLSYTPTNHQRYSTRALPCFSCHRDDNDDEMPPCVRRTSTLGYGVALFRLTHQLIKIHKGVAAKFEPIVLSCYVLPYLENFCGESKKISIGLAEHFSVQEHMAVYFLIKIFQSVVQQVESCKHHSQLYHCAAMKLLGRLHPGYEHCAHDLFSLILFSTDFLAEGSVGDPVAADLAEFLTFSDKQKTSPSTSGRSKERDPSRGELLHDAYQRLASIRNLYMVYFGKEQAALAKSRARCVGRPHEVISLSLPPLLGSLLPLDWPFLPLLQLFSEAQKAEMKGQSVKSLPPHIMAAVTDTLRWVFMLETWRPNTLRSIPLAAKIARLYCVFLTASDLFMEHSVHHYLAGLLKVYTTPDYMKDLNFDQNIPGLVSFNDLYDAFLTQFEAVSFGDHLFAYYALLPVQQSFSFQFRKALWYDHIDVLRTLHIHPSECPIPVQNFLEPLEGDPALISLYFTSLIQGKVRATWSPMMHLVAMHHVVNFVFGSRRETKETVHAARARLKLLKGMLALQNRDLQQSLLLYRGPDPSNPKGYAVYDSLPQDRADILRAAERTMQEQQSSKQTLGEGNR